jgi:hypothetical protein
MSPYTYTIIIVLDHHICGELYPTYILLYILYHHTISPYAYIIRVVLDHHICESFTPREEVGGHARRCPSCTCVCVCLSLSLGVYVLCKCVCIYVNHFSRFSHSLYNKPDTSTRQIEDPCLSCWVRRRSMIHACHFSNEMMLNPRPWNFAADHEGETTRYSTGRP